MNPAKGSFRVEKHLIILGRQNYLLSGKNFSSKTWKTSLKRRDSPRPCCSGGHWCSSCTRGCRAPCSDTEPWSASGRSARCLPWGLPRSGPGRSSACWTCRLPEALREPSYLQLTSTDCVSWIWTRLWLNWKLTEFNISKNSLVTFRFGRKNYWNDQNYKWSWIASTTTSTWRK